MSATTTHTPETPGTAAHDAPEIRTVTTRRIACDGGEGALGHPRVWLSIPQDTGWVECGYCDARFVLAEGAGGGH